MQIRMATAADEATVVDLARHFLGTSRYGEFIPFDPARITAAVLALITGGHGIVWIAEQDTRAIGMLAAFVGPYPFTGEKWVDELAWFVRPERRGRLAGPYLLRRLEEWAQENEVRMIKLSAPVGSRVAAFIERAGYIPVETSFYKRLD